MRYHEICERSNVLATSQPYEYQFADKDVQTHEYDGGGRLSHPIETTRYTFESENGLTYIVHCKLQNHVLTASFTVLRGGYALNGAGDAFRVLATVMKIVSDYCRSDPPRGIEFSARADEKSRVKLYDFMARESKSYFPGFILVKRWKVGRDIHYLLHRPLTQDDHDVDAKAAAEQKAKVAARAAEMARQQEEARKRREEEAAELERWHSNRSPEELAREMDDLERLLGL